MDDALYELRHPDEATRRIRAVPIFDPGPTEQLAAGPKHDLAAIFETTLERGRALLGIDGALPRPAELTWTDRIVRCWYGTAYWEATTAPGQGRIRVNRLLDSPDVDASVLEFLLWHEYLHLFLKQGHTAEFRERERLWPGHLDAHRFLANLNERFGEQAW